MESDGHQNDNAGLQSTNTTEQGAPQRNYIVALAALHTIILATIAILMSCIETKYPNGSVYKTVYGTRLMIIFIIGIPIYPFSLILLALSALHNNADWEDRMNKICLFCGTLVMIPQFFLLLKPLGWFIICVWSLCLICFVRKYYQSLKALCNNAVELLVQAWGDVRLTLVENSRRRNAIQHLVQACGEFGQKLVGCIRKRIRKNEVDNMSISKGERAIELPPHNLNISNDRRATEHQSQDQNSTSVAEHVLLIPDDSSYT